MKFFVLIMISVMIIVPTAFTQDSKILSTSFYSASLERNIPVKIYQPADYSDTGNPYRLYVYLHGAAGSVNWDYAGFMKPILDRLIQNGEIDPLLVAFPVITFKTVHGKAIAYDLHFYADSERNGKYASVITQDLLEWLTTYYNLTTRREERGIGGFSMGAAACVPIAIRNNDKFIACIAHDGQASVKSNFFDLPALFTETPGPPYNYNINNGFYSMVWFGFAAAYSPNLAKPNMPEWLVDFPIDTQGNVIDSVFNRWMINFDPATMLQNPDIYKNDIAIYIDATSGERRYNDILDTELSALGIPHTYWVIEGAHGIYEETEEAGLRFLDAAMDAAVSKVVYDQDIQILSAPACITTLNMFSNRDFKPQARIKNTGKEDQYGVSISCRIDKDGKIEYSDTFVLDTLKANQFVDIHFREWSRQKSPETLNMMIVSELDQDENKNNDTLSTTIEISNRVDDFESGFYKWTSETGWGISNQMPHLGEFCLEDKPFFSYDNHADTWAIYNDSFDFSQLKQAHLTFWTRHFFQKDDDAGYVEVSVDSGKIWQALGESIKNPQTVWYQDRRSLNRYCGTGFNDVRLRFHFISDAEKTAAGWSIDDIYIYPVDVTAVQKESALPQTCRLFANFPNPFNDQTTIRYLLSEDAQVKMEIFNSLGQKVKTLVDARKKSGEYQVNWDGKDDTGRSLSSGLYIYKFNIEGAVQTKKMLMLK